MTLNVQNPDWVDVAVEDAVMWFVGLESQPDFFVDANGTWWIREASKAARDHKLIFGHFKK
jgi:hypothetical protein